MVLRGRRLLRGGGRRLGVSLVAGMVLRRRPWGRMLLRRRRLVAGMAGMILRPGRLYDDESSRQKKGKLELHEQFSVGRQDQIWGRASIQTAIAIIPRFSVSEMKPSGTLLSPPTQAHLSSRLST